MSTEVDSLQVRILADNVTDSLSSTPRHVETEFARLQRNGMRLLAGKCICCASHGLSCLITARRGRQTRTLLFDTGPEADVFAHNVARLSVDLGPVDAVVLSHGHWDHAGGMLRALELIREPAPSRQVPLYAHPGMFRSRARQLRDGSFLAMEDVPSVGALSAAGADVISTTEPQSFAGDMFYLSGEIPRVTPFETGIPYHFQQAETGEWKADPWIMDERWVAVNVADKGLVIFTACSHAGVVNVLMDAHGRFPSIRIHTVIGGLHLSGPTEKIIPETVEGMAQFGLATIAAGHCTGWRAMSALHQRFGEALTPLAVGKTLSF